MSVEQDVVLAAVTKEPPMLAVRPASVDFLCYRLVKTLTRAWCEPGQLSEYSAQAMGWMKQGLMSSRAA